MNASYSSRAVALFLTAALLPLLGQAHTHWHGPISGTFGPEGNPYIVVDNCTVLAGTTLTLRPGVVVWIGEGLGVTVYGMIEVLGTPTQRVTIQAPPGTTQHWSSIVLDHSSGARASRFMYCDFEHATTAVTTHASGAAESTTTIMNCSFRSCTSWVLYAWAKGTLRNVHPRCALIVKNCECGDSAYGVRLRSEGRDFRDQVGNILGVAHGYTNARLIGNVFINITNSAVSVSKGAYPGPTSPVVVNNTFVDCGGGVSSGEPWDVQVQNNVFTRSAIAVSTSGSLSRNASYNAFFGNQIDFSGYPGPYGSVILTNRNGTPCDLLSNIFEDPMFVTADNFRLQPESPCIDAGAPDWQWTDMCFPPSQGSTYPDLGAFGGPDACNWLEVVPKLPATGVMTKSGQTVTLNWGALPRSSYQVQYTTNLYQIGPDDWKDFANGRIRAVDKPTSLVVASDCSQSEMYFRLVSLGRTAGD